MNQNIDKNTPQVNSPKFWDELYISQNDNWSINNPSPVFVHLIEKSDLLKKGKILILGCGKGHDAIYAAKNGFTVVGVDFSEEAIGYSNLAALNENYEIEFLCADFFELNTKFTNYFDYIFEYVSFCAVEPSRVNELLKKCAEYLKPNGKLITQLFPIDNRSDGPPYAIDKNAFYTESKKYFQLEYYSKNIDSIKPRKGNEILLIFKKKNDSNQI